MLIGSATEMGSLGFSAILEPAEEGGFVIKCLELPVATQGETKEQALANLKEVIEGYLEVKAEHNLAKNLVLQIMGKS